jgi:hypothetical protein
MNGNFFDPHYKPSRSAEKYRADQKRDRISSVENAAFVAEFLMNWTGQAARENPAEAFKALRVEARRLAAFEPSSPILRTVGPTRVVRAQQKAGPATTQRLPFRETFPKARFELDGSQKYLSMAGEDLMAEFALTQAKIESWRNEYDEQVSQKKREQLATQLQTQYAKRRDLIALVSHRLQD